MVGGYGRQTITVRWLWYIDHHLWYVRNTMCMSNSYVDTMNIISASTLRGILHES